MISGLLGSGKTTLAHKLAPLLKLPVIDKDSILEGLFESRGVGDAAQRRMLSRESDVMLQAQATASPGAILVSFWHQPGMANDSGTPTDWIAGLSAHIVNVHCACPPEIAAGRFFKRKRHPGHLDSERSYADVLRSLRTIASLAPLEVALRVNVDTSREFSLDVVVRDVNRALCVASRGFGDYSAL